MKMLAVRHAGIVAVHTLLLLL